MHICNILLQAKAERDARAAADGSSSGGANTAAADAFMDSIKTTTATGSSAASNVGEKRRYELLSIRDCLLYTVLVYYTIICVSVVSLILTLSVWCFL